jgi:uncharacterized protein
MSEGSRQARWKRAFDRPVQIVLLVAGVAIFLNPGPRSLPERAEGSGPSTSEARLAGLPEVDWMTLGELDYRAGTMSDALEGLVDREVLIPGFMVPLDDFAETVAEFLLVPYFGACVHTPPPPPNQLVYARTATPGGVAVEWWDPIWIRGVLRLDPEESVYGEVSWSMVVEEVIPYEY